MVTSRAVNGLSLSMADVATACCLYLEQIFSFVDSSWWIYQQLISHLGFSSISFTAAVKMLFFPRSLLSRLIPSPALLTLNHNLHFFKRTQEAFMNGTHLE